MIIFLDFDNTLFEVIGFKAFLCKLGALEDSSQWTVIARTNDLQPYLYPDVLDFLSRYSKKADLVLITTGDEAIQKAKVKQVGIESYFKEVIYTGDMNKAAFIKVYMDVPKQKKPSFFLDDRVAELEIATKGCPGLISVRMCRQTGEYNHEIGTFSCPRVKDLKEFEVLITKSK